jgi:nicotinamidase-related amidase
MSELPTDIDMASTALLVMDYQPMVLSPMRDAVNLLYRTKEAIGLMRDAGALVAYVRLALDDTDYASIPGTNKSFSRIGTNRYVHEDEPGTAIHHEIAPRGADIVVRKKRVGAFATTDLDRKLKTAGITTLILAGIHSSGVMLSTIRDAADRDYRLLVLTDCTSDPDAELHEVLMSKVFPRQAYMTTIADLKALISRQ